VEVVILVVVFGLVAEAIGWMQHQAQAARRDALARVAAEQGMRFDAKPRDWGGGWLSSRSPLAPFPVFQKGHSRRSTNHVEGKLRAWDRELPATVADYRYKITSGTGKNRRTRTYQLSFLLLRLPFGHRVPWLCVRREHLGHKIAAVAGFDDIDFESAEFSRRFHVTSKDRRFAYNLIDPRMIEFLLDVEPPEIAINEGFLLVTPAAGSRLWAPQDFAAACRWTEDFLARWPQFVVKDLSSA